MHHHLSSEINKEKNKQIMKQKVERNIDHRLGLEASAFCDAQLHAGCCRKAKHAGLPAALHIFYVARDALCWAATFASFNG